MRMIPGYAVGVPNELRTCRRSAVLVTGRCNGVHAFASCNGISSGELHVDRSTAVRCLHPQDDEGSEAFSSRGTTFSFAPMVNLSNPGFSGRPKPGKTGSSMQSFMHGIIPT